VNVPKTVKPSRVVKSREESNRQIIEYLQVPLRRPFHVAVPFVFGVLASIAALYVVPAKYKSSTLILVEAEKMPESFVTSVATERVSRRLQTVRQEVLSRTRLETVLKELNPYGPVGPVSLTAMVEWMRNAIEVTVKGTDAFVIDYVHRDPAMAQKVADRLAQLFIDETVQSRKQQVGDAYQFLETELQESKKELEKREEALRRYKEQHMGTLPEQMNANLATLQRFQLEQQAVSENLRSAMDRLVALESAPAPTLGKTGPVDPRGEIALLRSQLATMRTRYTDEHPDVRSLLTQIQALEKAIGSGSSGAGAPAGAAPQLDQARADVKNLRARLEELDRRIGTFQSRVELAPRTEQDIVELTRDFQKLNENYLALLNKKLEAQMAAKLEQRWQGDRFRILDPANLPERPSFPSRKLFLLAGVLLGLALGVATAFAADFFDHSIRSVRELEETLPFPVLAHIQLITSHSRDPKRRRPVSPNLSLSPSGTEDGHSEVAFFDRAREDRRQGRR
jgi:polysaccharide chain length determinant protein (PEP-CTERM system associated)